MNKLLNISVLAIFSFTNIAFSQVSGKILMDSLAMPGVEIKLKKSDSIIISDFDGNFSLPIESGIKNDNLMISFIGLTIEIKNIELSSGQINIGDFEIPYFKYVTATDFDRLSDIEKENCLPTYCWGQLLGYYFTNKLEHDYLTLNCKEKVTEFEFNPSIKTISVDWNLIQTCRQKANSIKPKL